MKLARQEVESASASDDSFFPQLHPWLNSFLSFIFLLAVHNAFILYTYTYFHSIIRSSFILSVDRHSGSYLKLQNQQ